MAGIITIVVALSGWSANNNGNKRIDTAVSALYKFTDVISVYRYTNEKLCFIGTPVLLLLVLFKALRSDVRITLLYAYENIVNHRIWSINDELYCIPLLFASAPPLLLVWPFHMQARPLRCAATHT
jgi:hypothetical protein